MYECLLYSLCNYNTVLRITIGSSMSDEEHIMVQNYGVRLKAGEEQYEERKIGSISTYIYLGWGCVILKQ